MLTGLKKCYTRCDSKISVTRGLGKDPQTCYLIRVNHRGHTLTSKENLNQILMEMKESKTPEIKHIVLKSTMKSNKKRRSML